MRENHGDPHENRDPHDPHDHPDPHKKPKKEKRRRRHGGLIFTLILIITILILILVLFNPFGWGDGSGFFGGKGDSSGESGGSSSSSSSEISSEISDTVVIKIDENTITIDGKPCADENALKEMITAIGTSRKYSLDHSTAIKETYDKVKAVLVELQDALGIEVDFNE